MSIQAVSRVLQYSESKLGARLVLLAIANHADAEGRNSYPSVAQLAAEARLSDRQVQRAIRTLERQGELRIVEGKGRHGTHLFTIVCASGDNLSPDNMSEGVTNRTSRGDISGQELVRNVTQTVKRTVLEPEKEDAPIVASEKERPADERGRGTRLPADWRACAACIDYAIGRGLDAGAIEEEFRDYWHAKDGPNARKRDWDATFRTWCRNASKRGPGPLWQRSGGNGPGHSTILAAVSRIRLKPRGEGIH